MKKLYIVFIMCLFALNSSAQKPSELIKSVREHYNNAEGIDTKIAFSIHMPESEPTVMEGKLFLKGEKYRFILEDQEIISDNVNQWHWSKGNIDEVQVSYIEENDATTITPSKIFSKFLRGYFYKLENKTVYKNRHIAVVEIRPSEKIEKNDIFKIRVMVDLDSNELLEMRLFENTGTMYHFEVLNQEVKPLEDSLFQFDEEANKNTEIIDLR